MSDTRQPPRIVLLLQRVPIVYRVTPELAILGPSEAPIAVLRGRVRWQLLLKGAERSGLHRAAHAVAAYKAERKPEGVRILIDVDPQSML